MSLSPELQRGKASLAPHPSAADSPLSRLGSERHLDLNLLCALPSPQAHLSGAPSALGLSNLSPDRSSFSCGSLDYIHWQRAGASDVSYGGSSASSYIPSPASRAREEAYSAFALNTFDFSARRSRATSVSSLRSTYEPSPPPSPTSEGDLFFADWTLASPIRTARRVSDMELDAAHSMSELRPFDTKRNYPAPTSTSYFAVAQSSALPTSPVESLSELSDVSNTADCGGVDNQPDTRPRRIAVSRPRSSSDLDHGVQRFPWAVAHRQLKHWLATAPDVLRATRLSDYGVTLGADVPKMTLRRAAEEGDLLVSTPSTVAGQAASLLLERQHSRRATKSTSSPSPSAALCDALTVHSFALPPTYVASSIWHSTSADSRINCLRWNGDVWLTVHDIIAVLVFRLACLGFDITTPAARAKLSEGCYSDLRACFEVRDFLAIEAGSSVLKAFASIGAVKSTKTQRVYRWGSICHDRLFVSALQRDVERVSKGIEVVCSPVREPALSLVLTTKPDVASQFGINDSPTVPPSLLTVFAFGAPSPYALGRGYAVLRAASENVTVAWDLPAGRNGRTRRSSSPCKPKPAAPTASSSAKQPSVSRSAPRLSAALPPTTPPATGHAVATRSRRKTLSAALA